MNQATKNLIEREIEYLTDMSEETQGQIRHFEAVLISHTDVLEKTQRKIMGLKKDLEKD